MAKSISQFKKKEGKAFNIFKEELIVIIEQCMTPDVLDEVLLDKVYESRRMFTQKIAHADGKWYNINWKDDLEERLDNYFFNYNVDRELTLRQITQFINERKFAALDGITDDHLTELRLTLKSYGLKLRT